MTAHVPESVSNSVSRTSVSPTYCRRVAVTGVVGAICQRPLSGSPSSAAKQAAVSISGSHSQSMEPFRPTSAAVSQSPMSA
jgi:hypothetical protein